MVQLELSTSLALFFCLIELICLRYGGVARVPYSLFAFLGLAWLYLVYESYASCELLSALRREMLKRRY
jgi:hypothetical protein